MIDFFVKTKLLTDSAIMKQHVFGQRAPPAAPAQPRAGYTGARVGGGKKGQELDTAPDATP